MCTRLERRRPQGAPRKNTAVRRNQTPPLACCAFSATTGVTASSPESGALSHSRAAANVPLRGVAPFPLVGLDRVASQQPSESITARDWSGDDCKARSEKIPPSGGINTTLPVVPEARQKAQQPAARNQERYRTAGRVLPRNPRQERTCVRDWSGDDRKARPGKARTLREKKKSSQMTGSF